LVAGAGASLRACAAGRGGADQGGECCGHAADDGERAQHDRATDIPDGPSDGNGRLQAPQIAARDPPHRDRDRDRDPDLDRDRDRDRDPDRDPDLGLDRDPDLGLDPDLDPQANQGRPRRQKRHQGETLAPRFPLDEDGPYSQRDRARRTAPRRGRRLE
jgi:hypothetical protein